MALEPLRDWPDLVPAARPGGPAALDLDLAEALNGLMTELIVFRPRRPSEASP